MAKKKDETPAYGSSGGDLVHVPETERGKGEGILNKAARAASRLVEDATETIKDAKENVMSASEVKAIESVMRRADSLIDSTNEHVKAIHAYSGQVSECVKVLGQSIKDQGPLIAALVESVRESTAKRNVMSIIRDTVIVGSGIMGIIVLGIGIRNQVETNRRISRVEQNQHMMIQQNQPSIYPTPVNSGPSIQVAAPSNPPTVTVN